MYWVQEITVPCVCMLGTGVSFILRIGQIVGVSDGLPSRDKSGHDRDIFNECPIREEWTVATSAMPQHTGPSPLANGAMIHPTFGDFHIRLFPEQSPLAVMNFVSHAQSRCFEGMIFCHIVQKFMIQTINPSETVLVAKASGGRSLRMCLATIGNKIGHILWTW